MPSVRNMGLYLGVWGSLENVSSSFWATMVVKEGMQALCWDWKLLSGVWCRVQLEILAAVLITVTGDGGPICFRCKMFN